MTNNHGSHYLMYSFGVLRDVKPAKAAFVWITIDGCERTENGAGIYEFKVFES